MSSEALRAIETMATAVRKYTEVENGGELTIDDIDRHLKQIPESRMGKIERREKLVFYRICGEHLNN